MPLGPERIAHAIDTARDEGRAALLVCVPRTGNDPEWVKRAVTTVAEAGADLIELQVTDILELQVLGPDAVMESIRGLTEDVDIPVLLWMHPEILYAYALAEQPLGQIKPALLDANVAGVAAPLPAELVEPWTQVCGEAVAPIFFVAPGVPREQLAAACTHGRGFMYAIGFQASATGSPEAAAPIAEFVDSVRTASGLPVFLGAGVRGPEQASVVGGICDGVAVAAAVFETINAARENGTDEFFALGRLVKTLKTALARGAAS